MTALPPARRYALGEEEAQRLWDWLLMRQGLSQGARLGSASAVAHASLGLHAARLPSPFATVLARSATPAVALSLLTSTVRSELMTVRCMRKTLHALPLGLASAAHAATLHFRERDALRAIANAGLGARVAARVFDAIVHLLGRDGPLHYRDIEARLVGPRTPLVAARLALKLAWERGAVAYTNDNSGWNREQRTFALSGASYPGFDVSMDRQQATRTLVEAYLDRYGPASIRDMTWWSGLSKAAIERAMSETSRELVAVSAPWCSSTMYMYEDRLQEFWRTSPGRGASGMNFLAHEDVALKAYFESRGRYMGQVPAERVFNQIGEARPTIVLDGRVVGTWSWDPRSQRVSCALVRGPALRRVQHAAARQAGAVSEALRLGLAPG